MTSLFRPALAVLTSAAAALALTACASDGDNNANAEANNAGNSSGDTSVERIVSLSPTATETLFAIGAGENVVAADEYSYNPSDAPTVEGLSGFSPNVEAILEYDPDLVILGTQDDQVIDGLESVGATVLVQDAAQSIDDAYAQVEELGEATGHLREANETAAAMQEGIEEAVASVPDEVLESSLTYFHELDEELFTITDDTFIGQVYSLFNLSSIATGATGYPQLTPEAVIEADPDIIFLAGGDFSVSPDEVIERPGWASVTAVEDGTIYVLDDDLASRWGPSLPEFVQSVADALIELSENAPELVGAN